MKQVSNEFKQEIKKLGKQQKIEITYGNTTLSNEEINSVTYSYESGLLKSIMTGLEIDSNINIPLNTEIGFKYGLRVNESYEYINYGNFIVYSVEKQEDTNSYRIIAYDKMLYAMKEYESLEVTYPVTLQNFVITLAQKIGLEYTPTEFSNYNQELLADVFSGIGYTYRDVLDDIAGATGLNIIVKNDELLLTGFNDTHEVIDEENLKNINVNFGENYGAINVIVLSRSEGADNIYYPETLPENPVEFKISDNQILNDNNRVNFIEGIYNSLNGVSYSINDFSSTGIMYLEPLDKYQVQIGETTYNCIMFNDEQNITQGLEENIHTDIPKQAETDYTKADTTDKKINKTNFIVDKVNQKAELLISQIGDRSEKQTTVTADIDGLQSRVEDIEDLTETVTGTTSVTLENTLKDSLVLEMHIYGNNTVFSSLFVSDDTIVGDDTILLGDSIITLTDEDNNVKEYDLGIETVLRQNGTVRDEYVYQYGEGKVIRRINEDGTIKTTPTEELVNNFEIKLKEGNNTIAIKNYSANMNVMYVPKNNFTDVFATKIDMNSSINQSATDITTMVNQTLEGYSTTTEMNSAITQTAEEINSVVSRKVGENEVISKINQSAEQVSINANKISLARQNN